ncbi:MAG TPA: peptidylprolyl isomerase [Rhizomicrobium sp.]|nr:peptidylprolyl isomerase [Rhizomicrobium sp.]
MPRKYVHFAVFGALLAVTAVAAPAQNLSGAAALPPGTQPPAAAPATPAKPDAPTDAKPDDAKPGDAKPGDTKPGDTKPDAKPDTASFDGVAALVNDSPITEYDLRQRILLFISTSGMQATPETVAKLHDQILKQLITEQLQIQEARHKNIAVSPTDVDKSIDRIVNDNHMSKEQLAELLKKGGVTMATLRAQIATQIAWQKAVQDEFEDRVNITPSDIDAEMARLKEGENRVHYLVSSIFLSVDNPDVDAKVLKDAQDIHGQLEQGANFSTVARQFSQSPTAAGGGDLGWIYQGQLPAELDEELKKMQPGQVSQPIRSVGGYYIMGLRDRQEAANAVIPDPATLKPVGPLTVARVLLPLGPKPPKTYLDNAMKLAVQIHDHVNGCDMLPKMAEQVRGLVYQDLDKMGLKIADLDPKIQDAINKAGPGEATPPFQSQAGVEMMVRCDKRAPEIHKWQLKSRQQVEEDLFDAQITMLSRRYLRDLRRNANVETK